MWLNQEGKHRNPPWLYNFVWWIRWIPIIFLKVIDRYYHCLYSLPSWFTYIVLSHYLKYIKDPLLPEVPDRLCVWMLQGSCLVGLGINLIHRYKADVKKSTEKAAAKLQRDVGNPKTGWSRCQVRCTTCGVGVWGNSFMKEALFIINMMHFFVYEYWVQVVWLCIM